MTTVKEFIRLLEPFAKNGDAAIMNHELQEFVHISNLQNGDVVISTQKPIGYCKRSGGYVFPTEVEDYVGVSVELNENVDLGEIVLPDLESGVLPEKFGEAIERPSKYKGAFYLLLERVKDTLPQEVWDELYRFDIDFYDR